MRALVIYRVDISDISNRGVSKKMQGHVYGLTQNGYGVDVIYLSDGGMYLNNKKVAIFASKIIGESVFKVRGFYKSIMNCVNAQEYDLVLVRFHIVIPGFIDMLKFFQGRKIVIDLPTYPYEREWTGLKGRILLMIDAHNRKRLREFVDLIMHYGEDGELFGLPCLNVSNGMLPVNKFREGNKNQGAELRLLAVGKWAYWHGLDRVIRGMRDKEGVILNIVGEGPELSRLKAIAKGQKNIIFNGNLSGEKLDELFNFADIGIGTLGIHRKGLKIDSSLKHREYCSRGLPFILSTKDIDFPEELDFVKYFEVEDGLIEIKEIVDFYEEVYRTEGIGRTISGYGMERFGWDRKMKEMLQFIS